MAKVLSRKLKEQIHENKLDSLGTAQIRFTVCCFTAHNSVSGVTGSCNI